MRWAVAILKLLLAPVVAWITGALSQHVEEQESRGKR